MKLIDMHCDTVLRFMKEDKSRELFKNGLDIDIEKMKKGDSLAQVFAMYIDLKRDNAPLERCLHMIDKFYIELDKNEEYIQIARNYNEIIKNQNNGKMSAILSIEEGGALKGELHHLRNFHRLGVRAITLTWNFENEIGYPNVTEEYKKMGLKPRGKEIVQEMNRLGMIIDVSHLSDAGFYDVANLSTKPFMASHSNVRNLKNHSRNLTDEMIKTIAEKGGLIGVSFESDFLGDSKQAKVEDIVKHIKYIKNLAGVDTIGIGSDFDGCTPGGEISNIGEIGKLVNELEKNNFSADEIEKIFYRNALRLIKEVTY